MNDTLIIIFVGFMFGLASGLVISRCSIEVRERLFMKKIEDLSIRNNEIFEDFRQVISFNNKLAERNQELSDRLDTFVREWNGE